MILETKVSYFQNTKNTEVNRELITLGEILERFQNGYYEDTIRSLRSTGDDKYKYRLPTFAVHGVFEFYRKANDFIESSGIIILDIDDVAEDEIQEIKEDILLESDHVLAAMTSPSGNGIKVLYYVQPELVNAANYRQIGKQIISQFDTYGNVDFLSVTDCLIATFDPDIQINPDVIPAWIYIEDTIEIKGELEPRDESRALWEDAEEFFETVLYNDIAAKTNSNFHFIQVSILDLAKFGFRHPQQDLSFVIDYAESEFKVSRSNKQRFDEVTELAKAYPQIHWPYRLGGSDDEYDDFEEEIDYSQFQPRDEEVAKPKKAKVNVDAESGEDEEDEINGFIDYSHFFDAVIEVVKEGDRVGYEVSFSNFADAFRLKGSGILTVTGIPGHGKTEFVDAVTVDLARLYGHHTIIAGFEQRPEEHIIKMIRKMAGRDITCPSYQIDNKLDEVRNYYDFIIEHFSHIDITVTGGDINKILTTAAKRIQELRESGKEVKYFVLDPFNMLSIKGRLNGHEKVEELLRRLTTFSHQMEVMVILVAHPTKMGKDEKTGEYNVPDFYSVKGSSAFFEMSYHGWTIYRRRDGSVMVKILKVKQNNLGHREAEVFFDYDRLSGRYIPVDEQGNELSGDHRERNWLEKYLETVGNNENN